MQVVDKTKKANVKCEHCKAYCYDKDRNTEYCRNPNSEKYGIVHYWNRCKCFDWK